jgi:hypothetical protein
MRDRCPGQNLLDDMAGGRAHTHWLGSGAEAARARARVPAVRLRPFKTCKFRISANQIRPALTRLTTVWFVLKSQIMWRWCASLWTNTFAHPARVFRPQPPSSSVGHISWPLPPLPAAAPSKAGS